MKTAMAVFLVLNVLAAGWNLVLVIVTGDTSSLGVSGGCVAVAAALYLRLRDRARIEEYKAAARAPKD